MKRPAEASFQYPAAPLPYHPHAAATLGLHHPPSYPYPPPTQNASAVQPPIHPHPSTAGSDDGARVAAEEDKRRRNTAASARFRVKKKEREKALEVKTLELEKQNQTLEQRIGQLETENEWLRGLVVEKNGVAVGQGASKRREREKQSVDAAKAARPEKEVDSSRSQSEETMESA